MRLSSSGGHCALRVTSLVLLVMLGHIYAYKSHFIGRSDRYYRLELSRTGEADELKQMRPMSDQEEYRMNLKSARSSSLAAAIACTSLLMPEAAKAADAIGYKAVVSPFAPSRDLSVLPLLPQSALLNSLPLENVLIGQLQAYLESFLLLLNPSKEQLAQVSRKDSILWQNLRINAQRAAGVFIYNRDQLLPLGDEGEPQKVKNLRAEFGGCYLNDLQRDVISLVDASRKASTVESLRSMRYALNSLCNVAYLLVDGKDCKKSLAAAAEELRLSSFGKTELEEEVYNKGVMPNDDIRLPTLEGRATVILEFQRPGVEPGVNGTSATQGLIGKRARRRRNGKIIDNLGREVPEEDDGSKVYAKLIVDGINHPLASGAFLDLCLKGEYDRTGILCDQFMFSASRGEVEDDTKMGVPRKIMGCKSGSTPDRGYVDARKKIKRRFPVEVLRQRSTAVRSTGADSRGGGYMNSRVRYTAVGSARNSAVFTQNAPPVLSFATYGGIGMWHSQNDDEGGSSSFFCIPFDNTQSVTRRTKQVSMDRLNQKYTLFAFCVDGNDVLTNLREGDVLTKATVEPGLFTLQR